MKAKMERMLQIPKIVVVIQMRKITYYKEKLRP